MVTVSLWTGSAQTTSLWVPPKLRLLQTGTNKNLLFHVPPDLRLLHTGTNKTVSLWVPASIDKELILQPVISATANDCSYVTLVDATGEYNGTTNTTGYNPESEPTNPLRPKRSEVDIYTGFIQYTNDSPLGLWTISEDQSPTLIPWTESVTGFEPGILGFWMIAVPTGTVLTEAQKETLPYIYETTAGWYGGQCPGIGLYCAQLYKLKAMLRKYNDWTMAGKPCEYEDYIFALTLEQLVVELLLTFNYSEALVYFDVWKGFLEGVDLNKKCAC